MSEEDNTSLLRTVTKPYRSRPDGEMNLIGLMYGAGLIIVLIPLLPFILIIWIVSKLTRLRG